MRLCQLHYPHNEYDFWSLINYHCHSVIWGPDITIYAIKKDITPVIEKLQTTLKFQGYPQPGWKSGIVFKESLRKYSPGKMIFYVKAKPTTHVVKGYISGRLSNFANLLLNWLNSQIYENQTPRQFLKSLTYHYRIQCFLAMQHSQSSFQAMTSTGMLEQGLIREVAKFL